MKCSGDAAVGQSVGCKPGNVGHLQKNLASFRGDEPRDHVEERGFPGPVRPDQAENLALPQFAREVRESADAVEALREAVGFQYRFAHSRASLP